MCGLWISTVVGGDGWMNFNYILAAILFSMQGGWGYDSPVEPMAMGLCTVSGSQLLRCLDSLGATDGLA